MKKEIKVVDEKRHILQITTVDERFYVRETQDEQTGLPRHEFVPSVTWICESYPHGIGFYKWLANHGWDEAIALRDAAGDKGSKIHYAINALMDGKEVQMTDKFFNHSLNADEELTLEEYEAVMSFVGWHEKAKPEIIGREFCVWGDGYAGMVDIFARIDQVLYIVDFKSSQYIWPSHELQLSAYREVAKEKFPKDEIKMAVLQLGYRRNKNRWKFTEIEDKYAQFLAAKIIWQNEHGNEHPKQAEYPLSLKLPETKTENKPKPKKRKGITCPE